MFAVQAVPIKAQTTQNSYQSCRLPQHPIHQSRKIQRKRRQKISAKNSQAAKS